MDDCDWINLGHGIYHVSNLISLHGYSNPWAKRNTKTAQRFKYRQIKQGEMKFVLQPVYMATDLVISSVLFN